MGTVMTDSSATPKRTILYYPTIAVPNGRWLRQALLYWDEVASIVPMHWTNDEAVHEALIPYSDEVRLLEQKSIFRPIPPDLLLEDDSDQATCFEEEFRAKVKSREFRRLLGPKYAWRMNASIHYSKLFVSIMVFLQREGLGHFDTTYLSDWFTVENKTALLYMSLLAQYLANVDSSFGTHTVTGTDRQEFLSLAYSSSLDLRSEYRVPCLDIKLINALPVPSDDTPIEQIIEFRNSNKYDLLKFRREMDNLHRSLQNVSDGREVNELVVSFRENIAIELQNLQGELNEAQIPVIPTNLSSLLKLGTGTFLGSLLAVTTGHASTLASTPLEYAVGGTVFSGLVTIAQTAIEVHQKKNAALRESPFTYLYRAQSRGLVPFF